MGTFISIVNGTEIQKNWYTESSSCLLELIEAMTVLEMHRKQLKYIRDKVWYIDSAEYYIERKLHAEFWRSSNKYRQAVEIVSIPLEKMNSAITGIVGD